MARFTRKHTEWLAGLAFITPNVLGFLVFTSIPVIVSACLSLYDWDMFHKPVFVGVDNFREMLGVSITGGRLTASDPQFWYSAFNTIFLMLAIPAQIALSLMLAVLLNRKLKGERILAGQGWAAVQMGAGAAVGMLGAFAAALAGAGGLQCVLIGIVLWLAVTAVMFSVFRRTPAWAAPLRARAWPILRVVIGFSAGLLAAMLIGSLRGQWVLGIGIGLLAGGLLFVILGRPIVSARTMFFLPSITAGVATYLMWMWLLNTDGGPINRFLEALGIPGPNWLDGGFITTDQIGKSHLWWFWAKPAIMIMGTWIAMGGTNMILYLAGLQGINPQLYEAAEIDGAGGWGKFAHITLPMLAPTTFFIAVISVIGGFQGGFGAAYVMTSGGPEGSTTTISYYIFRQAFEFFRMGYAAAIAWVLFALVFVFTLLLWRRGKGTVY